MFWHLMKRSALSAIVLTVASSLTLACSNGGPSGPGSGGSGGGAPRIPADPIDPGSTGGGESQALDFDGLPPGTIVDQLFGVGGLGPIGVRGTSPGVGGFFNAALIFDSSTPTGGDSDLGTPNETFGGPGIGEGGEVGQPFQNDEALGHLLIVGGDLTDADADGLVDDPNDANVQGNRLILNFSGVPGGTVTADAITLVDIELDEPRLQVELYATDGTLMITYTLEAVGDNGVGTFSLGPTSDVARMEIVLNGSGAIADIFVSP